LRPAADHLMRSVVIALRRLADHEPIPLQRLVRRNWRGTFRHRPPRFSRKLRDDRELGHREVPPDETALADLPDIPNRVAQRDAVSIVVRYSLLPVG
jgi:hypothetical protein